jgi:hypothetical protein
MFPFLPAGSLVDSPSLQPSPLLREGDITRIE